MYGWSFAVEGSDELARLVGALGKHRYVDEVDLRVHFLVDRALASLDERFAEAAKAFDALEGPELDVGSRDPRLWREASVADVARIFELFWDAGETGDRAQVALATAARIVDIARPAHAPFAGDVDEPAHPELLLLDWTFLSVDRLDTERHKGALRAMEDSSDEADASEPIYVEGPPLTEVELCGGGERAGDVIFWADGPYSYVDYVFRGVSKAAKLAEPPVGHRDVDKA